MPVFSSFFSALQRLHHAIRELDPRGTVELVNVMVGLRIQGYPLTIARSLGFVVSPPEIWNVILDQPKNIHRMLNRWILLFAEIQKMHGSARSPLSPPTTLLGTVPPSLSGPLSSLPQIFTSIDQFLVDHTGVHPTIRAGVVITVHRQPALVPLIATLQGVSVGPKVRILLPDQTRLQYCVEGLEYLIKKR